MKKLRAKVRRLRTTRWDKLTLGEKIVKVVFSLLKIAAIVAAVVAFAGVALTIFAALAVAFGIASAFSGGFSNASKAYRPGDVFMNDRRLM